jgi:hypothetical protein
LSAASRLRDGPARPGPLLRTHLPGQHDLPPVLGQLAQQGIDEDDDPHHLEKLLGSGAEGISQAVVGFVLGEDPAIKMFGLGLATAILVDATLVRMVLVPATMRLIGDATWWLASWLDRLLPTLDVEGSTGLPMPEAKAAPEPQADHAPAGAPA